MSNKILIADRHEPMRPRIRAALERAGFQVCGETIGSQEAIAKTKDLAPDLVILDLADSSEVIPELLKSSPSLKIIIFTIHEGDEIERYARRLGAQGYAVKSDLNTLIAEVQRLLNGTR